MHTLKVIASNSRPVNHAISVTNWIMGVVQQDRSISAEFLDLDAMNLPSLKDTDSQQSMQGQYELAKSWKTAIKESDAFIIVLSENSFDLTTAIKTALNLYLEWKYKPVAFVSYGNISGGFRSMQTLKPVVTALGMMPISEAVSVPLFSEDLNGEEKFVPRVTVTRSAYVMLSELKRWSKALKAIRSQLLN